MARARIEELGGRLVAVIEARPGEHHYRMADPEGNEFTVVLPPTPDVARAKAYGPKVLERLGDRERRYARGVAAAAATAHAPSQAARSSLRGVS